MKKTVLIIITALALISCERKGTIAGEVSKSGYADKGAKVYVTQLRYDTIQLYQDVLIGQELLANKLRLASIHQQMDRMIEGVEKLANKIGKSADDYEGISEYKSTRGQAYEYDMLRDEVQHYTEDSLAFEELKLATLREYDKIRNDVKTIHAVTDKAGKFSIPVRRGAGAYKVLVETNSVENANILDGTKSVLIGTFDVSNPKRRADVEAKFTK